MLIRPKQITGLRIFCEDSDEAYTGQPSKKNLNTLKLVLVHLNKSLCQPGPQNSRFLHVGIYCSSGWSERKGFRIMELLACRKLRSSF